MTIERMGHESYLCFMFLCVGSLLFALYIRYSLIEALPSGDNKLFCYSHESDISSQGSGIYCRFDV